MLAAVLVLAAASCATLQNVVQPPRFSVASGRQAELRLTGPTARSPLGGATIRIWANVQNPNALGLTLAAMRGNLFLDDTRAADVDFPLGLPLLANQDTVIPLDITIGFNDLPGLANVASRWLTRNSIGYRLDGTVSVDAGLLGQPTFGPNTWMRGDLVIRR